MDIAEIARVMQIDTDRVWLLLALHDAIVELEALKVDTVPTEGLRALIRAACYPANATFGVRDDVERIEHGRMSDENLDRPRRAAARALTQDAVGDRRGARLQPGRLAEPEGRSDPETRHRREPEKQYHETISCRRGEQDRAECLALAPARSTGFDLSATADRHARSRSDRLSRACGRSRHVRRRSARRCPA